MKWKLILFCLLGFSTIGLGQNDLFIQLRPVNTILRFSDSVEYDFSNIEQPLKLSLDVGEYPVELWAPGFKVLKDTIRVKARSNIYRKKLKVYSQNYLQFRENLKNYRLSKYWRKGTTYALLLTDVALPLYTYFGGRGGLNSRIEELDLVRSKYEASINFEELGILRSKYEELVFEYDKKKNNYNLKLIIGSTLSALSIGATIFHLQKKPKGPKEKPNFSPNQPFDISFGLREVEPGEPGLGLTLRF